MKPNIPWNIDGIRDFGETTEKHLLLNKRIRDFLDYDHKFFLIGAKGIGKTVFMRYKSYRTRLYNTSLQFNGSQSELTDNLDIHPNTFSKEELLQFRNESIWLLLWELTLWVMVFRIAGVEINPQLEKIIEKGDNISTILTRLLNNRKKIEQYRAFISEFQDKRQRVHSGIAIFIDDVDQAIHNFLLTPHYTDEYYQGDRSPSLEIWINAQMGLVGAIYNITRQNNHYKIHATIRREAFEAYDGELKSNYNHHASVLQYDKGEIRQIFEKNIQLIPREELVNVFGNGLVERFFGFDLMPHRFAVDGNGNSRSEDIFDFIYRHTYGRPREILSMGQAVNDIIAENAYKNASESEKIDAIRTVVNRRSHDLLLQYKKEIVPYFDEDEFAEFLRSIRGNVITTEDLKYLNDKTIQRYYNLGLLGITRTKNLKNQLKQDFKAAATYNYRHLESIPDTDYLLIHSTLDATLLSKHSFGQFYNKHNIIGHEYDFYPVPDRKILDPNAYIPLDVTGNRMASPNPAAGHNFPLKDIFEEYFQFDKHHTRFENYAQKWDNAKQVLFTLSRICFCHLLEKEFKDPYYGELKAQFLEELNTFEVIRPYNREMPDSHSPESLIYFRDKLIGRFITLGAYLVLDMRVEWIHNLLLRGKFEFKKARQNRAAMAYLTRSFFIKRLSKEEPRDNLDPKHRVVKQRIFDFLSQHEKDSLNEFIKSAAEEMRYGNFLKEQAHIDWLYQRTQKHLWHPK